MKPPYMGIIASYVSTKTKSKAVSCDNMARIVDICPRL